MAENVLELAWPTSGTMGHHVLLLCYAGYTDHEILDDIKSRPIIGSNRTSKESIRRRRVEFRQAGHCITTSSRTSSMRKRNVIQFPTASAG